MDSFKFSYAKKKKSKRDLNHCITGKRFKNQDIYIKVMFLSYKTIS